MKRLPNNDKLVAARSVKNKTGIVLIFEGILVGALLDSKMVKDSAKIPTKIGIKLKLKFQRIFSQ